MSLRKFKITEYDHRSEQQQFDHIAAIVEDLCPGDSHPATLIGNYSIEGVVLDAVLIVPQGVILFGFKDGGGNIVASETGSWTLNDQIIAGGAYGKSPFVQARLNRSRAQQGLSRLFNRQLPALSSWMVFTSPSSIDVSGLSTTVQSWLTVCDDAHLQPMLSRLLSASPVFDEDFLMAVPELLQISRFDTARVDSSVQRQYVPETAASFFDEIEQLSTVSDIRKRYSLLGRLLNRIVDERLITVRIKFAGLFSKIDYLLKEHSDQMPDRSLGFAINALRHRINTLNPRRHETPVSNEELTDSYQQDMAALVRFVSIIYRVPLPAELDRKYPFVVSKDYRPLLEHGETIRVVVNSWDSQFIHATTSEGQDVVIDYVTTNKYSLGDRHYLTDLLMKEEQLNIVRPRVENDIIYPELIIFNPDYLIDISSIASCFLESENCSSYQYFLKHFQPAASSEPIMLGNFAGQILDEELYGRESTFDSSYQRFFRKNALNITRMNVSESFRANAEEQKEHIQTALNVTLPHDTGNPYQRERVILEPSFFSEVLGLQGRMDFLQDDFNIVIEQKSGRASNNPKDPTPVQTPSHYIQLLLYMAVLHYNYGKDYRDMHSFLLYSRYANSLLQLGVAPRLMFRALVLRNQIVWLQLLMSKGGARILDSLKPELVYRNEEGQSWERFIKPGIQDILQPIQSASALEKDYFFRMVTFLTNEQLLTKVGNRTKEDSGFASAWNESLDVRLAAGNIYDQLQMDDILMNEDEQYGRVVFRFTREQDNDMSNFRLGDIVIFYHYPHSEEPLATQHIVFRGSIVSLDSATVVVELRNPQTDKRVLAAPDGHVWALEHDFMEASYTSLYRGLHAFLRAPQRRRDLLLSQRQPEVDTSVQLRGDYTNTLTGNTEFNDLVLRVMQARDLFLIIGPPGTGKTSFGMLNVLKEQLLVPGSSVLLMSYTNRAVDEMCKKLVDDGIDFIRIGSELGCSEEYRSHLLPRRLARLDTAAERQTILRTTRVFCGTTTAFNSNLELVQMHRFDMAIVDEASQILEPHLLGLLAAKVEGSEDEAIAKFVLIGDEKQLPAVVQQTVEESTVTEPSLRSIRLTDCRLSLFERFITTYRQTDSNNAFSYMLTRQGRMHRDIADFPNQAFYQSKLIPVPLKHQEEETPQQGSSHDPIENMIMTHRVAFVPCVPEKDSEAEYEVSDKVNQKEAQLIASYVAAVWRMNRENFDVNKTVGVIVPYRNQISTIRNEIEKYAREYSFPELRNITIDTVERYQGSQRETIIYGFTVSKYYQLNFLANNQYVDPLSGDVIDRKLNVAMTRAMSHLIMVGNPYVLRENKVFAHLMAYCKSKDCYLEP